MRVCDVFTPTIPNLVPVVFLGYNTDGKEVLGWISDTARWGCIASFRPGEHEEDSRFVFSYNSKIYADLVT